MKKQYKNLALLLVFTVMLSLAACSSPSASKDRHFVCTEAKASSGSMVFMGDLMLSEDGTATMVVSDSTANSDNYIATWRGTWSGEGDSLSVSIDSGIGSDGDQIVPENENYQMVRTCGSMELVEIYKSGNGKLCADFRLTLSVRSLTVTALFSFEEA